MEEKRYPTIEEEEGMDMCSEPVVEPVQGYESVTTKRPDGTVEVHDWIDDLDWSRFPSQGPFSEEEAIARIDRFEERLAKGEVKFVRVDDLHAELKKLHPWL